MVMQQRATIKGVSAKIWLRSLFGMTAAVCMVSRRSNEGECVERRAGARSGGIGAAARIKRNGQRRPVEYRIDLGPEKDNEREGSMCVVSTAGASIVHGISAWKSYSTGEYCAEKAGASPRTLTFDAAEVFEDGGVDIGRTMLGTEMDSAVAVGGTTVSSLLTIEFSRERRLFPYERTGSQC